PTGVEPGMHLPLDHWPPDSSSCHVRSERSFVTTYPAMWSQAASGDDSSLASLPMTTPSSTSQSVLVLRAGIRTGSSGPATVLGVLRKSTGTSGGAAPDSAACAA